MVKIRRGYQWTRRRIINWSLIMLWIALLAYAWSVPPDSYGRSIFSTGVTENTRIYHVQIGNYPPVSFRANLTFQTIGVFSAVNDIQFTATIYNATANLTQSYCCIASLMPQLATRMMND
jgi:ABC-type xylose transport system permease subunit